MPQPPKPSSTTLEYTGLGLANNLPPATQPSRPLAPGIIPPNHSNP